MGSAHERQGFGHCGFSGFQNIQCRQISNSGAGYADNIGLQTTKLFFQSFRVGSCDLAVYHANLVFFLLQNGCQVAQPEEVERSIGWLLLDKADLQVLRELSRYGTPKDYQRHGEEAYYVLRKQAGQAGLGGGGRFYGIYLTSD